jgi:hypothetical protein
MWTLIRLGKNKRPTKESNVKSVFVFFEVLDAIFLGFGLL